MDLQFDSKISIFLEELKDELKNEVSQAVRDALSCATPQSDQPDLLSRQEAANLIGCSLASLTTYQKKGSIPYYRIGRKVLFKKNELLSLAKVTKKGGRHV